MKKKLSNLLMATLLLAFLLPLSARAAEGGVLRLGLAYKDDVKAAVTLQNKVGTGYRLGYYDDQRHFVALGWTDVRKIGVLITQNLYLTSSGGYSYTASDRGAVGCFHVQLPDRYTDFASAQAVADTVEGGFVAWIGGTYYVRVGSYTGRAAAQEAADAIDGATMGETSGYGYSVVSAGSTKILFQFDANLSGETGALGVVPITGEGERAVTTYNGELSCYGGFRFERIGGGASTVVNMIDREDYIKCVVPYEMSPSWPIEALKAQAVCARTYAGGTNHKSFHFDLCTTTHCQAYKGTAGIGEASDRAVDETAGQMLYYNGKCVTGNAVYYSSNGGASEDAKNIWGGDVAYLVGKLDPYEADIADRAGNYKWSKTLTGAEVKKRAQSRGYGACGDVVDIALTKISPMGNVIEIKLTDVNGKSYTISPGDKVRGVLGTNSIRFTMSASGGVPQNGGYAIAGSPNAADLSGLYALSGDGTVAALPAESYVITDAGVTAAAPVAGGLETGAERTFTFTGTGWGHSVGMSQWGAYAMAKQGFGYQDILRFYYTGITIQ